jgi:membrane fusion protein
VSQLKVQVERYRQLARDKFAPELQVQQKQDDLAEQAVKLETLKRTRVGIERDIALARTEMPTLRATAEGKLAALSRDEANLTQTARENLSRRAYEVTAANDGTVERIIAVAGQTVAIGSPLMQVQTGSRALMADIYVPTRSAGFLRVGQTVRLAIDAFPMERFGHVAATVTDVGRSVIAPGDALLPAFVKEPVFRVRATLAAPAITAYGESYALKSGLSAQADISLDERPLYRWIIEPILRLRGRL